MKIHETLDRAPRTARLANDGQARITRGLRILRRASVDGRNGGRRPPAPVSQDGGAGKQTC